MAFHYLAQKITVGGETISGPLGSDVSTLGGLITKVVNFFLIPLAGTILFIVLIWGGFDFIISRGNPDKLKSAKAKLTTGLIGFVLLVIAYLIVRLLSIIFGLGKGLF